MILPVPVESFQSYVKDPGAVAQIERRCPLCETRVLSRNGTYNRWVYLPDRREKIVVFRLRCRPCRLTVALLPDMLVPYVRYALGIVEAAIGTVLEGASCRTAAVEASGAELPTGVSVTDALTWTPTTPSYQRVHNWLAQIVATAAADVQAAAEWLARRMPDGLGAHLVTTPLEPVSLRSPRAEKRADLAAARLFMRLFKLDPDLNPLSQGWLRAAQRFTALILRRPPWHRPPPVPQSS